VARGPGCWDGTLEATSDLRRSDRGRPSPLGVAERQCLQAEPYFCFALTTSLVNGARRGPPSFSGLGGRIAAFIQSNALRQGRLSAASCTVPSKFRPRVAAIELMIGTPDLPRPTGGDPIHQALSIASALLLGPHTHWISHPTVHVDSTTLAGL